jgi:O-antigen/teichoic acid export membrane protein
VTLWHTLAGAFKHLGQPISQTKPVTVGLLLRGIFEAGLVKVTAIGASVAFQLIAIKQVGVVQFGVYAELMAWIVVGSVLASGGVEVAVTRLTVTTGSPHLSLSTVFRARLMRAHFLPMSLAATLLLSLFLVHVGSLELDIGTFFMVWALAFQASLTLVLAGVLRGQKQVLHAQLVGGGLRPIIGLCALVAITTFMPGGLRVESLILAQVAGAVASVVVAYWRLHAASNSVSGRSEFIDAPVTAFRSEAYRAWIVSSTNALKTRCPVLVSGLLFGSDVTAGVAIASQLSQFVATGSQLVNPVVVPMFAAIQTSEARGQVMRAAMRATWVISGAVTLFLSAAGEAFLGTFDPMFTRYHFVLVILCAAELFTAVTGPVGNALLMSGKHAQVGSISVGWAALGVSAIVAGGLLWGVLGLVFGSFVWTLGLRSSLHSLWRAGT